MYRELLERPHISSYSACLLLAFVAGYILARWRAVRAGIAGRHIDNVSLIIPFVSLFGARVFSWLFYMPAGTGFIEGMTMERGGLVLYGGVLFALVTVVTYAVANRLSVREMADIWAAPLALGLAIGRLGCFLAGCCWGDVCAQPREIAAVTAPPVQFKIQTLPAVSPGNFPLAVRFPPHTGAYEQHVRLKLISAGAPRSAPVHPVQLYEAALALLLAIVLHRNFGRGRRAGEVFCSFLVGYGVMRFAMEFFRADNSPAYWGLTISQVISVCSVLAGGGLLLLGRVRARGLRRGWSPRGEGMRRAGMAINRLR